jgi:annexin A7/11
MQDSALYYAKQLHNAMSGIGTKDKALIRIVVTGCEFEHLDAAKKAYQIKYKKSLSEDVGVR